MSSRSRRKNNDHDVAPRRARGRSPRPLQFPQRERVDAITGTNAECSPSSGLPLARAVREDCVIQIARARWRFALWLHAETHVEVGSGLSASMRSAISAAMSGRPIACARKAALHTSQPAPGAVGISSIKAMVCVSVSRSARQTSATARRRCGTVPSSRWRCQGLGARSTRRLPHLCQDQHRDEVLGRDVKSTKGRIC